VQHSAFAHLVTEFQCYGTETQQIAFLQKAMLWMVSQSNVARYANFGVFPYYLFNSAVTPNESCNTLIKTCLIMVIQRAIL
jgi:hypothetical protein